MPLLTISSLQQLTNFLDTIILDRRSKMEAIEGETPFFTDEGVINLVSKLDRAQGVTSDSKVVARIASDLWLTQKTEIQKLVSRK